MCNLTKSGSLTREPMAPLSAGQPKSMQHLLTGMALMGFALRFAEGQGRAGVVCGTVEEQGSLSRPSALSPLKTIYWDASLMDNLASLSLASAG